MSNYQFSINNNVVIWTEETLKLKLEGIVQLKDKQTGWIKRDLEISPSWWITRVIWSCVAKYFGYIREHFYKVNLEETKNIFLQLKPELSRANADLLALFNQAVNKFNEIAPNHQVKFPQDAAPEMLKEFDKKEFAEIAPNHQVKIPQSAASKMLKEFDSYWDEKKKQYRDIAYNEPQFISEIKNYLAVFATPFNKEKYHGYIEKKDVDPDTKIYVRADLHGALKSLIENIKSLQKAGLLDENLRCGKDVQLVFLGDYSDRGAQCIEVLRLLMALKMANPDQVNLIRGNHESIKMNDMYGNSDINFMNFLEKDSNAVLLDEFYGTLPLTLYIGQKNPSGEQQYVQFTHGLFELHMDVHDILNNRDEPHLIQRVPRKIKLSRRVRKINFDPDLDYSAAIAHERSKRKRKRLKQACAAYRIRELLHEDERDSVLLSAYNWGDVNAHRSMLLDLGSRNWYLTVGDVKEYLRLSGGKKHKVKLLFRGHEHEKQHHLHNNKLTITTLPVGMDSLYADRYPDQLDTCYILTTSKKVRNWTKSAHKRMPGSDVTEVTDPVGIRETTI